MNPEAAPPLWTQHLLRWLLARDKEESVSGDLLEEYREAIVPARGPGSADVWYLKQVAGFLWRLSAVFALAMAAQVIVRNLFDAFAPPVTYRFRSEVTTYLGISTFLLAGAYGGFRTGRARTGVLVAMTASIVGHAISILFDAVMVTLSSPYAQSFVTTGDWGEALGLPPIITIVAAAQGLLGGLFGKSVRSLGRRPQAG